VLAEVGRIACSLVLVPVAALWSARPAHGQVQPLCVTGCGTSTTISVTPDGQALNEYTYSTNLLTFVVSSAGPDDKSVTLTCTSTGGAHCLGTWPVTRFVDAGQQINFNVTDSVGSTGGRITLTASGTGIIGDAGYFDVTAVSRAPTITMVTPALSGGGRSVVHNRTPVVLARLYPGGLPIDTTRTALIWQRGASGAPDTVSIWHTDSLSVARANRGLVEWEPDSLRSIQDSARATLVACNTIGECTTDRVVLHAGAVLQSSGATLCAGGSGGRRHRAKPLCLRKRPSARQSRSKRPYRR
jgi:hypothetical protein